MDKKTATTEEKMHKLGKTGLAIGAAVVAGATLAVGGMMKIAGSTAEAADRIDKMSQSMGMSTEAFQTWDYILSQNGVSIDGMKTGMKTLTNSFDDLKTGGALATETFGRLGLSYEDMAGLSQEQIFEKTVVALQGVEDGTERAALANDLFGRSGADMAALLNAGTGSVEEMKLEAEKLGLVMGEDAIAAGVQFTDSMDKSKRTLEALGLGIGTQVMPIIQKMLDWFIDHMPEIQAAVAGAFEKISSAISWVKDNSNWLIPVLGTVAGAFLILEGILIAQAAAHWIAAAATTAVSVATGIATAAQWALNVALNANPIGLIIIAIVALVAGIIYLWKTNEDFRDAIIKICETIYGAFETAWDGIKSVWSIVAGFFQGVWNGIVEVFSNVIGFYIGVYGGAWQAIVKIWSVVVGWFANVVSGIGNAFSGISTTIINTFAGALTFLSELPGRFLQTAKDAMQSFWNGILEMKDSIVNSIGDVANAIIDKFKNLFGIESPSRVMFDLAGNVINGFINGLNADSMLGFIEDMVKKALGAFGGLYKIKDVGTNLLKMFGVNVAAMGDLAWPTSTKALTSSFGIRDSPGGIGSTNHQGVDVAAGYGDSVKAGGPGTITQAGWNGGYGNSVRVDYGDGWSALYAHLSKIIGYVGDFVDAGTLLGLVGSTGNSTGAHLHYGVYKDGVAIDPTSLPSYNVGTTYVPSTGPALIHKGEAVVTASDNASQKGLLTDIKNLLTELVGKNTDIYIGKDKIANVLDNAFGQTAGRKARGGC